MSIFSEQSFQDEETFMGNKQGRSRNKTGSESGKSSKNSGGKMIHSGNAHGKIMM